MNVTTRYEDDVVAWSEEQVAELRRLAAMPALTNAVDWENVIEEIESAGRDRRIAVESLLRNALVHILKLHADPDALAANYWRREIRTFLSQARERMTRSMARQIDIDDVWGRARNLAEHELRLYGAPLPRDVPIENPFSAADLGDPDFDVDAALAVLGGKSARGEGRQP